MKLAEPRLFRWTRGEYHKLAEMGCFDNRRVQLLDGEIIEMPAQGSEHVRMVAHLQMLLARLFGDGYWVRTQAPLGIGEKSEPEPDLAVVPGTLDDYPRHPASALLVVEISDTTLRLDRRKATTYAGAGVGDYWIIDLNAKRVEVYREPATGAEPPAYASVTILSPGQTIAPLARPETCVTVAELLREPG